MNNLLQFILLFLATVVGIIGYFVEFRKTDEKKPLKKIVWLPVSIIVIMFIISTVSTYIQYYDELQKISREKEKSEADRIQLQQRIQKEDSLRRIDDSVRNVYQTQLTINLEKSDDILSNLKLSYNELRGLNKSTRSINQNFNASITTQNNLLHDQKWIQHQILRLAYPLQPLILHYVIEYSFDRPSLTDYSDTLEFRIMEIENKKRKYYQKLNDLRGSGIINITERYPQFLPRESDIDLRRVLSSNEVELNITDKNGTELIFPAMWNNDGSPLFDTNQYTVTLSVDYSSRKFIKYVRYVNPYRKGNDNLTFSTIDLVNRNIEVTLNTLLTAENIKIGFQFQYDYDYSFFDRFMNFEKNYLGQVNYKAKILPQHLGLDNILNSIVRK